MRGIGLAVGLGIIVWVGLIRRHGWLDHVVRDGTLVLDREWESDDWNLYTASRSSADLPDR